MDRISLHGDFSKSQGYEHRHCGRLEVGEGVFRRLNWPAWEYVKGMSTSCWRIGSRDTCPSVGCISLHVNLLKNRDRSTACWKIGSGEVSPQ